MIQKKLFYDTFLRFLQIFMIFAGFLRQFYQKKATKTKKISIFHCPDLKFLQFIFLNYT